MPDRSPAVGYRISRTSSGRRPGDLIQPGAFGAAVELGAHALRERTIEAVRAERFPSEVSRFSAVFAWLLEEQARRYLNQPDSPGPEELWEVEIGDGVPVTRVDALWLQGSGDHDEAHWREVGGRYWGGLASQPDGGFWELLIAGPIRLRRRLDASVTSAGTVAEGSDPVGTEHADGRPARQ